MVFVVDFVTFRGVYRSIKTEKLNVPTEDGRRGILSNHMPIVLPLSVGVVNTCLDKKESYFAISDGILTFENNKATILSDSILNVEEIDNARAEKQLTRAQERLEKATDQNEIMLAKASMAKALNKLDAKSKYGRR